MGQRRGADAAIEVVACANTRTTFGGLIALQNLVNNKTTHPSIVSISYGECEERKKRRCFQCRLQRHLSAGGSGGHLRLCSGWDEGAASCDAERRAPTHGIVA